MALQLAILLLLALSASTASAFFPPVSTAPDGPGTLAYLDLARKDCIGTAGNTTSRVWFTLADGVLSDVYYPTLDNTNVKTLEYVITDGKTFTDLQTRDTTYTVESLDKRVPACRIITTAKNQKYRVITDYITDPAHHTVLANIQFVPLVGTLSDYHLYLRFDPTINGNGGGGIDNGGPDSGTVSSSTSDSLLVACDSNLTSNATNRTYAEPVCSALAASHPFLQITNGFVGQPSDGLTQLDTSHALTNLYTDAYNGNLVQTAQVDLTHTGTCTLALGFGKNAFEAAAAARASLNIPFTQMRDQYTLAWTNYDAELITPPPHFANIADAQWGALVDQYYENVNLIKASEDKTFPGAIVASPSSPWGQAISAGDPNNLFFGSYREVFARDAYHAALALYLAGDRATARDVVSFLFEKQQQADGSFPRNSLLNGERAPDSQGIQLDEVSYPILLAQQFGMNDAALYQAHIKPAANFLISHGPAFGTDRWEEQTGYSPSTLAAEIAALVSAASIAEKNNDTASANIWRGVADAWQRSIVRWTVTTNGSLSPKPYFVRLSKTGDPNAAVTYNLGSGSLTLDQRNIVDAGFLELVRLGLISPDDPLITQSLTVVDANLKVNTPGGAGWHRYNDDGYGDSNSNGAPWAPTFQGNGHIWSLLTAERGEYALSAGDRAAALSSLITLNHFSNSVGLLPEQIWERSDLPPTPYGTDPAQSSIGFQDGQAAGSASPLIWSAGAYVRLFQELITSQSPNKSCLAYDRYVTVKPGELNLTAAAQIAYTSSRGSLIRITGTSLPNTLISIAATNTDHKTATNITTTHTNAEGTINALIPASDGNTILNIVGTNSNGSTGHFQYRIALR